MKWKGFHKIVGRIIVGQRLRSMRGTKRLLDANILTRHKTLWELKFLALWPNGGEEKFAEDKVWGRERFADQLGNSRQAWSVARRRVLS